MAEDKCPGCGAEQRVRAFYIKYFCGTTTRLDRSDIREGAKCIIRQRDALQAENALLKGAIRASEAFQDGFCIFCGDDIDSDSHRECLLATKENADD